ncbi:hypothetical protein N5P37_011641 [Trichoderma harzianum]|nr:hypothetical protein N5P37_011641 [Trichoderma harzianum]
MAKLFFHLGLFPVLFSVLVYTVLGAAPTLDQLFIIQSGTANGGCDAYTATMNNWLIEINYALQTTLAAIDKYETEPKVRAAFTTFFGVKEAAKATTGVTNIRKQTQDDTAKDYQGNGIIDKNGNLVPIESIPGYKTAIGTKAGNKIWWSGQYAPFNGYYFSPTGADYCSNPKSLGLTSFIQELEVNTKTGTLKGRRQVEDIIICPSSFTTSAPDSFTAGDALISAGTGLDTVLPKSATLLHESFHNLFGTTGQYGFLQTGEEYNLMTCISWANVNAVNGARKNPENYVFFAAHMFYLYGTASQGISKNWDFEIIEEANGDKKFGAKAP